MKGLKIMDTNSKLTEMGITLPEAPAPAANYIPFLEAAGLIFISGQVSQDEKGLITGVLGDNMSLEEGYKAARCCAISLVAQLKNAAGGDLNRVKRVVKLGGVDRIIMNVMNGGSIKSTGARIDFIERSGSVLEPDQQLKLLMV